jgi:hypothetical protein
MYEVTRDNDSWHRFIVVALTVVMLIVAALTFADCSTNAEFAPNTQWWDGAAAASSSSPRKLRPEIRAAIDRGQCHGHAHGPLIAEGNSGDATRFVIAHKM